MSRDDVTILVKDVRAKNRRALAKAITLFEDARAEERPKAAKLLSELLPYAGKSVRIGISGAPGVGKSTFIEAFGSQLVASGKMLAVLAVDPTSPVSGGSILGDRVRMEHLSAHPQAFIRPSPSGQTLGGVARHTREAIVACEAAGYEYIFVETVGVGQSETVVASMVDLFLMLCMPNAGDEIQGIKRGILEVADVVAVTKADGALLADAQRTRLELEQALGLARGHAEATPSVCLVSSTEKHGLAELETTLASFIADAKKTKAFEARRKHQASEWFEQELVHELTNRLELHPEAAKLRVQLSKNVADGQISAAEAAAKVVDLLTSR